MTGIFDDLSQIAANDNPRYRKICISILDYMLGSPEPKWLKHVDVYEMTDQDCKTLPKMWNYMWNLRRYLKGEIEETGYHFLDWILADPYYEEEQIPFFDMLHDEAHRLSNMKIISTDGSIFPPKIHRLIRGGY